MKALKCFEVNNEDTRNDQIHHIQTIRWQKSTNCLSVFDHFVGLALKGLTKNKTEVRKGIECWSKVCHVNFKEFSAYFFSYLQCTI